LPLVIKGLHLLIFLCFLVGSICKMVGHFPCLDLTPLAFHFASYDHHDLDPACPKLQHIGGVLFCATRCKNLNLLYFA
jgi:hypothetical protein